MGKKENGNGKFFAHFWGFVFRELFLEFSKKNPPKNWGKKKIELRLSNEKAMYCFIDDDDDDDEFSVSNPDK
jgi:hypothetical protein